jgi:putative endonuclease
LARALAWHARGRRFDPDTLHKINPAVAGFFCFMPFYTYILYSTSLNQYYIGHTENLQDRIFRHTNSGSKSTKKADDWVVKYTEGFDSRSAAMQRELEIKKKKSRKYIEWLLSSVG